MLHDDVQARQGGRQEQAGERRRHPRVPFPAEAIIIWHHDPTCSVRFRVQEASDGGLRLRSSLPLPSGLTGVVTRLLPNGEQLDRSVMVVWCRQTVADDEGPDSARRFDIGLRWF